MVEICFAKGSTLGLLLSSLVGYDQVSSAQAII